MEAIAKTAEPVVGTTSSKALDTSGQEKDKRKVRLVSPSRETKSEKRIKALEESS